VAAQREVLVSQHFNGLTPAQAELLALLAEECAEVIQVIAKIQRHGLLSCNPNDPERTTNLNLLHRELGDVRAAMVMLSRAGVLHLGQLPALAGLKLERVREYLHHTRSMAGEVESSEEPSP
jgi:NTP pyrophosphatase (non-canonical NTP hydrolase)